MSYRSSFEISRVRVTHACVPSISDNEKDAKNRLSIVTMRISVGRHTRENMLQSSEFR